MKHSPAHSINPSATFAFNAAESNRIKKVPDMMSGDNLLAESLVKPLNGKVSSEMIVVLSQRREHLLAISLFWNRQSDRSNRRYFGRNHELVLVQTVERHLNVIQYGVSEVRVPVLEQAI